MRQSQAICLIFALFLLRTNCIKVYFSNITGTIFAFGSFTPPILVAKNLKFQGSRLDETMGRRGGGFGCIAIVNPSSLVF